ncbi:MAG: hypothetical protein L0Y72_03010 [Gemmataceae bacterium]|nr:hypothetical protein [Gemmataceae bacterium]MCI0737987.1 hypothetical protein [Gemmataceae bacterium]
MKVTEKTIQPGTLTAIHQLTGGHKGEVFLLENDQSEKLVVKFQNEATVEAVAGSSILKTAGARTPMVRPATRIDISTLLVAVATLKFKFPEVSAAYAAAKEKFKNVLLMEFAEGKTLKKAREQHVDEFLTVLSDPKFQTELGRIVAADTFAGNRDRMFAVTKGRGKEPVGWYHEQNLFLGSDGGAVAIDNAFEPRVFPDTYPWGQYLGGIGVQWGSIASACDTFAKQEAKVLFDKFLDTAAKDHPGRKKDIEAIRKKHKESFIQNFADGARQAMQTLMMRGQGWKQTLTEAGANEEMLRQFRVRKRLLRQFSNDENTDPEEAEQLAKSDDEYRKWVLTKEYKLNEEAAENLLKKGIEEYKKFKKYYVGRTFKKTAIVDFAKSQKKK